MKIFSYMEFSGAVCQIPALEKPTAEDLHSNGSPPYLSK